MLTAKLTIDMLKAWSVGRPVSAAISQHQYLTMDCIVLDNNVGVRSVDLHLLTTETLKAFCRQINFCFRYIDTALQFSSFIPTISIPPSFSDTSQHAVNLHTKTIGCRRRIGFFSCKSDHRSSGRMSNGPGCRYKTARLGQLVCTCCNLIGTKGELALIKPPSLSVKN